MILTDNEIIKALEICGNIDVSCKGCVFANCELCRVKLAENAFILINRQQAEIENYKARIYNDTEYIERIEVENRKQKAEIERLNEELKITRTYIHDNGLEWDLLSYSTRNGG